jgi:hypothetical protein
MAITTQYEANGNLRVHIVTGELGFDDLVAMLSEMYEHPAFRPDQDALWDLREALLTKFSTEQVREVGRLVRDKWLKQGEGRSALVVARKADFGMARMYEAYLGSQTADRTSVFSDIDEARIWLRSGTSDG